MPPALATVIYAIGILGLCYLDRDKSIRTSRAIWIPAIWLFLISSRPVSLWLGMTSNTNEVDVTQAYVEGSPTDRNIFIVLLLANLAVIARRAGRVQKLLRKNVVIVLYLSFCLISIVWSEFSFVALKRWTKAAGEMGMVLIILTESDPFGALKSLLTRLGFLLFPLSILFIKYYPAIGRRLTLSWTFEATGVATQKNELGLDCMIYGVAFLWSFMSVYNERDDPNRRRRLLAYGAIIGMVIWLLNQCNSTTSIIGFISAGGVMWVANRPSSKPVVVHLLVLTILSFALTALFLDSGGNMVQALGKDPSLTGRTDIWNLVLGLHTNPWIGTGFESFWLGPRLEFMRNALPNFPINEAHNGYVEIYLNLGWAGLIFVTLLILTAYNRIISIIRKEQQKGVLFLGCFLCMLFYSFSEAAFRPMTLSSLFLLLIIMGASHVASLANRRTSSRGQTRSVTQTDEKWCANPSQVWPVTE